MSGKLCTGTSSNNAYRLRAHKAFSEGIYYRAGGTAVERPVSGNPHAGGDASTAWGQGWFIANSAAPNAINQLFAPCVALPGDIPS